MNKTNGGLEHLASVDEQLVDQRFELMKRHWKTPISPLMHDESRRERRPELTIAISRQKGALGSKIASLVGNQLGWPVYDRELVDVVAERAVLRTELLESIDEHDRSWFIETLVGLAYPGEISSAGYVHHLKHVMAALSIHGGCVIVGRGASAFLPRQATLCVRFHAPLDIRVERVAQEKRISPEVANTHIKEVDRSSSRFVADHFGIDVADDESFDIDLNTGKVSEETCVQMILMATRSIRTRLQQS